MIRCCRDSGAWRFFGKDDEPAKQRTRICVECGMPVAEHKDWCSVLRGQNAMKLRAADPRS